MSVAARASVLDQGWDEALAELLNVHYAAAAVPVATPHSRRPIT